MNSVDAVIQKHFSSLFMNCTGLKQLNQIFSFVLLLLLLNQGLGSQETGHFNTAVIRKPLLRQVIELPLQKGCLLCGEGSQSTLVLLEHRHFNRGGLQVFHLQSIVVQHSTRGCNLFGAINRADVASVLITKMILIAESQRSGAVSSSSVLTGTNTSIYPILLWYSYILARPNSFTAFAAFP